MIARSKRHPALLRAEDALLAVIDMQDPFLRNVWEREPVLANVVFLARAASILRVPIVPTLQNARMMGGVVAEVVDALPTQSVPFDKMCFSCVGEDAFSSEIHRSGRKQILICGVEAHICVLQTALDMQNSGYQVHVAADAVTARSRGNVEVALAKMEHNGIIITSAETAVYEMLAEAGTPEFREILELIKAAA